MRKLAQDKDELELVLKKYPPLHVGESVEEARHRVFHIQCLKNLMKSLKISNGLENVLTGLKKYAGGIKVENRTFGTSIFFSESTPPNLRLIPINIDVLELTKVDDKLMPHLFDLADGHSIALLANLNGMIRGLLDISSHSEEDLYFHATKNKILAITLPPITKLYQVFYDGKLIYEEFYVNKILDWSYRDFLELFEDVEFILEKYSIRKEIFEKTVYAATILSHKNFGAIFVIGNETDIDKIQKKGRSMTPVNYEPKCNILEIPMGVLCNLGRKEGAILIDNIGNIRGIARELVPQNLGKGKIGTGTGKRHKASSDISTEISGVVITVSEDNLITIFEKGEPIIEF